MLLCVRILGPCRVSCGGSLDDRDGRCGKIVTNVPSRNSKERRNS